jgi:transposase
MDGKQFEVVSVVERGRQWPPGEKARIMEEALAAGATVASVADRNGVCRSQVYVWLRKARAGQLAGVAVSAASCALFAPVKIGHPTASACPLPDVASPAEPAKRRPTLVEIALGNGRSMKVYEDIDPAVLAKARRRARRRQAVITVPAGVRIYLACGVTDMRKGFDSLAMLACLRKKS